MEGKHITPDAATFAHSMAFNLQRTALEPSPETVYSFKRFCPVGHAAQRWICDQAPPDLDRPASACGEQLRCIAVSCGAWRTSMLVYTDCMDVVIRSSCSAPLMVTEEADQCDTAIYTSHTCRLTAVLCRTALRCAMWAAPQKACPREQMPSPGPEHSARCARFHCLGHSPSLVCHPNLSQTPIQPN